MILALYRGVGRLAAPLGPWILGRRLKRGKEDAGRLGERLGQPGLQRPAGPLVWLHAASVGEAQSVLLLIERLIDARPDLSVLVTSGTVTSAELMHRRLPAGAFHQFVPIDLPGAVDRFIAHWRPDLALWIESELWPGLIGAMQRTGRPMVLLNARMSARSFARWNRVPALARALLAPFRLVLAQSEESADRFRALGAANVRCEGNLKYAARPLDCDDVALAHLRGVTAGRPVWLAASIHPGEDGAVIAAHIAAAGRHGDLLTVIVPRHPARGPDMAAAARAAGLPVALRSAGEDPGPGIAVLVADTMGELGLFCRLAPVVFVGGSLVPHGGQNLLEPARLGCALLAGPHTANFQDVVDAFRTAGALAVVDDADALGEALCRLLDDDQVRARQAAMAERLTADRDEVLDRVLGSLVPLLPAEAGHAGA
ncbi:MAG: 3-deoxy-D-manno-octulosonic acid transferase [Pseudomonadota bacterium]|nr:3-deoxy-D-manno-octulosonic acid transferase [Pseudomonadota bacterium]